MNFKTTYLLFGILALLVLVLGLVLYTGPSLPAGTGYVLGRMRDKADPISPSDVDKVHIQMMGEEGSGSMVFEKNPETKNWRITSPRALPGNDTTIKRLIDQLYDARAEKEGKQLTIKEAELDKPQRTITLSKGSTEVKLTLGAATAAKEGALVYVTADNAQQPMAVKKSSIELALEGVNAFRSNELLGPDTETLQDLKLAAAKKGPIELKKESEGWRMIQPPAGEVEVESLMSKVRDLKVEYRDPKDQDFVADGVTDLAKYNLDAAKQDVLRIEAVRGEKDKTATYKLLIGISKKVAGPDGKEENRYYATALTDGKEHDIVRVTAASVKPFLDLIEDPTSVRNKSLVTIGNFRTPDAIVIDNSYKPALEFLRPDVAKPWQLFHGAEAVSVEEPEVQRLLSELTKKDAVQLFPDPKRKAELGLGDGKGEATVSVYVDGVAKEEKKEDKKDKKDEKKEDKKEEKKPARLTLKKDAKPVAVLRFGNRENGMVAVERTSGSESTLVMVPEALLDLVKRSPLAYMDKSVPKFSAGFMASENVTKLVLERDGTTFEVAREKITDPWKLVKPDRLKGRNADARAVDDILNDLNRLKAIELVKEKADASELAGTYGLKMPSYKAVVTVLKDGKPTTHEYDFGKETPKGVYAKVGDRDTIYLLGTEVLAHLKRDLPDPTIFKFDPKDVESVKIAGWKELLGSVTTRTFEHKEGKWTVKEQPEYVVDAMKLETFLGSLAHLQAEKFVTSGKGLSLDQNGMEFEIRLKGQKDPLELLVGGQEGASYFATSRQVKDEVFLVPSALFDGPRTKPGHFSVSK
jgi:hypothetical protein